MKTTLQTLAFFAAIAWTTCAWAEGDAEVAQEYFDRGAGLYVEGKFGEALVQFKRGHEELPNAMFPYSMSLCNLKLARYDDALRTALEARKLGGLGEKEGAQNDARIAVIPRLQSSLRIAEAIAETNAVAVAETIEPIATAEPSQGGSFGTIGWIGVGTTVVGAGLLVGALVTELSLQSKWDDYEAAGAAGDAARFDELKGEIDKGQKTGTILVYTGAGVTALGLTLIIVDLLTPGEEGPATAGVFIAPGGGIGGAFSLRF